MDRRLGRRASPGAQARRARRRLRRDPHGASPDQRPGGRRSGDPRHVDVDVRSRHPQVPPPTPRTRHHAQAVLRADRPGPPPVRWRLDDGQRRAARHRRTERRRGLRSSRRRTRPGALAAARCRQPRSPMPATPLRSRLWGGGGRAPAPGRQPVHVHHQGPPLRARRRLRAPPSRPAAPLPDHHQHQQAPTPQPAPDRQAHRPDALADPPDHPRRRPRPRSVLRLGYDRHRRGPGGAAVPRSGARTGVRRHRAGAHRPLGGDRR